MSWTIETDDNEVVTYELADGRSVIAIDYEEVSDDVLDEVKETVDVKALHYMCRGHIEEDFIEEALERTEVIFLGSDDEGLVSFILGHEKDFFFYIDLVCTAPGKARAGQQIIDVAYDYATRVKDLDGLSLSALAGVVGFYRKLGFLHRDTCAPEREDVKEAFEEKLLPLMCRHGRTVGEYIRHEKYEDFLEKLMEHRLTSDRMCRSVDECNEEGYLMTKCSPEHIRWQCPHSGGGTRRRRWRRRRR